MNNYNILEIAVSNVYKLYNNMNVEYFFNII